MNTVATTGTKEIYQSFNVILPPKPTLVVVDDGAATGNTLMNTIGMLKKSNPHNGKTA
ncbi:hypothetical protein [Agriterribacter sp.]|uniref:hypothetical protein n=1 Tax=Agriterribacter sp. TaxID=2821509 RepID=UPI002CE12820|nr:hypothetical protein [Agriterribacter sp.]HRP54790.1 hypothetical protein [Agriterribacter sp.]